jgi:site-specific recombinase XerD
VIVLMLLDTGIRASELTGLKIDNTHLEESYLKVFGKGSKERIVPFGAGTRKALLRYLTTFRPEQPEPPYVILSTDGGPLTNCALGHSITRLGRASGVPCLRPNCSGTLLR